MTAPTTTYIDPALGLLVDELIARQQAGESVDWSAAGREHPEFAEALAALRPALVGLGHLSGASDSAVSILDAADPISGILGDFRLIREVGRGGMGVVYEAEQISLNRRVALKVLPFAAVMDARALQRFRHEAQAAAMLHHPHIVPVYGVGCERGVHYYAMQLIEGQSLAAVIDEMRPASRERQRPESAQTPVADAPGSPTTPVAAFTTRKTGPDKAHYRRVAELVAQAADAVEFAHSMGVVHRDVKPANLILDDDGHLWVTDFGLAKLDTAAGLTLSGDLVGTLRYMSPEQALAKHGLVDHRTDVYSLGATLYELLTLRPAVEGEDKQELLRKIAFEEPAAPRTLDKAIPAELETVALKALAKEPAERYASAGELADDLRRWLNGRSIRARPLTWRQQTAKWVKQHSALVGWAAVLLSAVGVALAVGLAIVARAWGDAERTAAALRLRAYAADMRRAYGIAEHGTASEYLPILAAYEPRSGEDDVRGFEWHYLKRLADTQPRLVRSFSYDGQRALTAIFSPDESHVLVAGEPGAIEVFDAATGERQRRLTGHTNDCNSLAYSPDGRWLVSCGDDKTIRVRDTATWSEVRALTDHTAAVHRVAFSPDNRLLASAGWDKSVRLWNVGTWTPAAPPIEHTHRVFGVEFSPDSRTLATCCVEAPTALFDVASLTVQARCVGSDGGQWCTFSPDSKRVAVVGFNSIVATWNVADGLDVRKYGSHRARMRTAHFARDGSFLVTCGDDARVRMWSMPTGALVCDSFFPSTTREGNITWSSALSADGRRLLTVSDREVRLWQLPSVWPTTYFPLPRGAPPLAVDADGPSVAYQQHLRGGIVREFAKPGDDADLPMSLDPENKARGWDSRSGLAAFEAGSRTLAFWSGGADLKSHRLKIWDVARRRVTVVAPPRPEPATEFFKEFESTRVPEGIALVRGGTGVLAAYIDGTVVDWEPATGRSRAWQSLLPDGPLILSASRDGRVVVFGRYDRWRLWDAQRQEWAGPTHDHANWITSLALSDDGTRVAVGDDIRSIRVFDARSGAATPVAFRRAGGITRRGLAFSPDGRTLAAAADGGGVQLLHVATGEDMGTLRGLPPRMADVVAFRSDGTAIVAANLHDEAYLQVWHAGPQPLDLVKDKSGR